MNKPQNVRKIRIPIKIPPNLVINLFTKFIRNTNRSRTQLTLDSYMFLLFMSNVSFVATGMKCSKKVNEEITNKIKKTMKFTQ